MVTAITLGNFFTSNGKTVLGGVGGSGLDTEALIEGLTEARSLAKVELEDKVALNGEKSTALSQLKSLLGRLKDAANFIRNPPGVSNAADNVFKATSANLTSNTAVAASNYLSVTTSAGATHQSYSITEITSVAKATQQATGNISIDDADSQAVFTSAGANQFQAGTVTINDTEITLSDGDTLNGVAAKFNAVSSSTGINATVIQVSDGTYQLFFSATQTGEDSAFDLNDIYDEIGNPTGTIIDPDGVFSQFTFADKQTASNAEFILNGTTIIRQSNVVNDVITGVTFNLQQATPEDTTLGINVVPDNELVKSGIINFANVYNELRIFAAEQSEIGADGLYKDTAVLSNNQTLRSILDSLGTQVSSIVSGITGGDPTRLADIGITLTDLPATADTPEAKNIITIDEGKLTNAIASNFDGVRRVFEFDLQSTNPNLRVFSRTNALDVSSFTLNLNPFATQTTETISIADADTDVVTAVEGDGLFKAGTLTIRGQDITFTLGDSLNDILAAFQAVEGDTGLVADLEEVSAGNYRFVFTSTVDAGSVNFDLESSLVDPDGVFGEVDVTAEGAYTATYTDDDGEHTIDVDATLLSNGTNYRIEGQKGTVLEGLVLLYSSTYATSVDVTTTQGIADKIYNVSYANALDDTGSIAIELDALSDNDDKLAEDIARIEDQIVVFRNQLIEKFSRLESALSQVNTLLQSLQADADARNNG